MMRPARVDRVTRYRGGGGKMHVQVLHLVILVNYISKHTVDDMAESGVRDVVQQRRCLRFDRASRLTNQQHRPDRVLVSGDWRLRSHTDEGSNAMLQDTLETLDGVRVDEFHQYRLYVIARSAR